MQLNKKEKGGALRRLSLFWFMSYNDETIDRFQRVTAVGGNGESLV